MIPPDTVPSGRNLGTEPAAVLTPCSAAGSNVRAVYDMPCIPAVLASLDKAHRWRRIGPSPSQSAAALAKHAHTQQRQRMLMVARAIRAAKGLPTSEHLNG